MEMLDTYTTEASKVIPVIPASEYYCDYVTFSGVAATQISAYNVDANAIKSYYPQELENKGFYIYNGVYSDGTPHQYAYKLATVTNDLRVEYVFDYLGDIPVYSIVVFEVTSRMTTVAEEDYKYLFDTTIPTPEAESFESFYDNTYSAYVLFAHNTGEDGVDKYYQKLVKSNEYQNVPQYSSEGMYYFTSVDGYTNISFYKEYDEYNRASLVVKTTTNSFRIYTISYLGSALPNFTDTLDTKTSFTVSQKHANTFLIYFGPTTEDFYNSYCDKLVSLGWTSSEKSGTENVSITFTKGKISFRCMFGVMGDTNEATIVIVIDIPEVK